MRPSISNDVKKVAVTSVGALYGKSSYSSLHALRAEITKKKNTTARKLPLAEGSFSLHLMQCIYELMIWHQTITPIQEVHGPTGFAYE
jgi:hypothetical protein